MLKQHPYSSLQVYILYPFASTSCGQTRVDFEWLCLSGELLGVYTCAKTYLTRAEIDFTTRLPMRTDSLYCLPFLRPVYLATSSSSCRKLIKLQSMHTYIDALMSCSGGAPKDTARVQMNQLDGNVKQASVCWRGSSTWNGNNQRGNKLQRDSESQVLNACT